MKERPLLMSAPMVHAILAGRKSQTRRIIKVQPPMGCEYFINGNGTHAVCFAEGTIKTPNPVCVPPTPTSKDHRLPCPFEVGMRLWVRETTIISPKHFNDGSDCNAHDSDGVPRIVQYLATHPNREASDWYKLKATPSIFMPRWASRITLEVTGVRVERVNEISEADCSHEGIRVFEADREIKPGEDRISDAIYRDQFVKLWNSINAKRGFTFESGPYVWVVEFRKL